MFAACVPGAQSAVTDIVSKEHQTGLGLSPESAAAQLGVVVGPLASATFQGGFKLGQSASSCLLAVFIVNAVNALFVLGQMTLIGRRSAASEAAVSIMDSKGTSKDEKDLLQGASDEDAASDSNVQDGTRRLAQPMLRTITIIVGWKAILSNSIYGLFAPRVLGFKQPQLRATYSAAAVLMVLTQSIEHVQLVFFPSILVSEDYPSLRCNLCITCCTC